MADPLVSIVMPCLNQIGLVERAIRSVLEQAGPFELIVIDGGSTDGTRQVIERYADRLAWWVSEPDRGQSHAINKGFARATGSIFGWLNADDVLCPSALMGVRKAFRCAETDVLCGACRYESAEETRTLAVTEAELRRLDVYDPIHQPSCFWRAELHRRAGGLNEALHFGMDWDLWLRFQRLGARFSPTPDVLSVYHMTGANKTSIGGAPRNRELYELLCRYNHGGARLLTEISYRLLWPLKRMRRYDPVWLCRPLSNLARTSALVALGPMLGFDRVRCSTHPYS